jgi:hypothetical protein
MILKVVALIWNTNAALSRGIVKVPFVRLTKAAKFAVANALLLPEI